MTEAGTPDPQYPAPGTERVLFAEWGFRYANVPAPVGTRSPCPICGHPTGDCIVDHPLPPEEQSNG